MSPVTFEVGKKYKNMKGCYEVVSVDGNAMRIRWDDGEEVDTTVIMQRRIIERMKREGLDVPSADAATAKAKTRGSGGVNESPGSRVDEKKVGIKKRYLKTRKVCKVTFRLPRAVAGDADHVSVVGDFNDWNATATPMKKCRNQDYTVTLELEPGREYQFRYLIDGSKWENDWHADKYVKSPFGDAENSVVST